MNDQIFELAKKIKALADSGVGGEKINAEAKLRAFLKKHGLQESDLDIIKREDRVFEVPTRYLHLFAHIVWSVIIDTKIYRYRGSKTKKIVACSNSEMVEIKILFQMYRKAFDLEVKIFEKAFILKNNLGYTGNNPSNPAKIDQNEKKKLHSLMNGIDTVARFKGLLEK